MGGSILIGCAGWALRRDQTEAFPGSGTHLARYARRLPCVEINSSFYKPHRRTTYERWAASTPAAFQFAVKTPERITHERRLVDSSTEMAAFLHDAEGLGEKLGVLLVQLPPSLALDYDVADGFFGELRERAEPSVTLVCEPRHESWFTTEAERLLAFHGIGRVAADPSLIEAAAEPGGNLAAPYFRWHGSPRVYWSSYDEAALAALARRLYAAAEHAPSVWCILDNTAEGAALLNALELDRIVQAASPTGPGNGSEYDLPRAFG
jgi:uncharacterized protein YecE (DUF72 family)